MSVLMLVVGVVLLLAVIAIATTSESAATAIGQTFEGEVVRRYSEQVTLTTGMRTDHRLDVRTDDGEVISLTLPGRVCSRFAVGDRIVKRAGERWPSTA
ncbi:hypothetical protein [Streptomyces sp. TLI_171]|uniref:DUF7489 domain-containing protein n=1 Tax=Streptomyces sp. TLI_171 TaxID=1938859 RepID=UPI000C17E7FF|nr:hypothetical protein [Streptomyces sp. TLI_171]RKE17304.1 hypothetical protein BX266_0560 [Streptomyces sp. TLI_171]